MKASKRENNMVWIDLEMSGLDPKKERILEIASIITDSELNILEEGPNLVIRRSPQILKRMDSWNQKQHKKSGLIEEVKKSKINVKKAEELTLKFIKKYCLAKKSPLCGNTVHHDRFFIVKEMPLIHEFLHYRHVDVTSVKGLIQRWYPAVKDLPKKKGAHRALGDIRESIEELQFYRKKYFK